MKKIILLLSIAIYTNSVVSAQEAAPKIIFSNQQKPAAANSKESFTSKDFIYGSIDLGGKTVKEFFKLPEISEYIPYSYLYYVAEVYKGDKFIGDNNWNITLVKEVDTKNKILYFDVLPDPAKAVTILSGTPVFDAGLASGPLYSLVNRQYFKESGSYTIRLRIYYRTTDAYGNEQPYQKWPTCEGSFTFEFNEDDVPMLLKNGEAAGKAAAKKGFK